MNDLHQTALDALGALKFANKLLVAHFEETPIDWDDLENYFDYVSKLIYNSESRGSLIAYGIDSIIEAIEEERVK